MSSTTLTASRTIQVATSSTFLRQLQRHSTVFTLASKWVHLQYAHIPLQLAMIYMIALMIRLTGLQGGMASWTEQSENDIPIVVFPVEVVTCCMDPLELEN
jgi:hypothetical protein